MTFVQKTRALMKMTPSRFLFLQSHPPGLSFTNIFMYSFYARSSQKRKIQSSCQYLFTLLGSTGAKAAHRTLMKLSPDCVDVNFSTEILRTHMKRKLISLSSNYTFLSFNLPPLQNKIFSTI